MVRGKTTDGVEDKCSERHGVIDAAPELGACHHFDAVLDRLPITHTAEVNSRPVKELESNGRWDAPVRDTTALSVFCDETRALACSGALEAALERVTVFVLGVISRGSSWANVFSSPALDRLCLEFGRLNPLPPLSPIDQARSVFIVTGVYRTGGHTRVLMDLVRADPGARKTVLVSNVRHDLDAKQVSTILAGLADDVEVEVAPPGVKPGTQARTLTWLMARLAALRPARTYNLQHPFDAAIVAASQPELTGQLFYYHHADHALALGVHIPHATHVDVSGRAFHHCRLSRGIADGVYWPLVAEVGAHREAAPFLAGGKLVTATSGSMVKFDTSFLAEKIRYRYDYCTLLPKILRVTGGTHVHIGPLPHRLVAAIHAGLIDAGVDPSRFIHLEWAKDVGAELIRRGVDLYVGSFPLGGGRVAVEMMGAGLPLLLHRNYISAFFSNVCDAYPGAMSWGTPDELMAILQSLDAATLAEHALQARAYYEAHHRPELLDRAVAATLAGCPPKPPPPPAYFPDALQHWLDSQPPLAGPCPTLGSAKQQAQRIPTKFLTAILLDRIADRLGLHAKLRGIAYKLRLLSQP
jgi:hypothetical protein